MLKKVLKKGVSKVKSTGNGAKKKAGSNGSKKSFKPLEGDVYEMIKARAYEIYCKRSKKGKPGDEKGDWLVAEKEVKKELRV